MNRTQGFSLTEVVISLSLMVFLSLMLIKHHWQTYFLLNRLKQQTIEIERSENAKERLLSNIQFSKHMRGVGLPELLIALFLSSLVTVVLMRQYLIIKVQYQQIQHNLKNNSELALVSEMLRNSAKKAGFTPCSGIHNLKTIDQRDGQRPLNDVEVINDVSSLLKFNHMSEHFDTLLQIINPYEIVITGLNPLKIKQSVIIADCFHAEVQHVKRLEMIGDTQRITFYKPLSFSYDFPVYVGEWIEELFYIKQRRRPALFYKEKHAEELTSFIRNLKANLLKFRTNTVLQIVFDLGPSHPYVLETMVRMR